MDSRNQILIVDDMEINRAILCELFQNEYAVLEAENGLEALELVRENRNSIAVILLDIVMPVMDGFQLMEHLQEDGILNRIPVILITADTFRDNEITGLNLGASDIIIKPFDPHIVKKRVQNSVELYQHKNHLEDLVAHQTKKLTETNDFVIDALSTVIEYRSLESGHHIRRIRVFTRTLLECVVKTCPHYKLTKKMIDTIVSASAMHDIGKIAISDAILLKPGKLTAEEFEVMKTHTTRGCEILTAFQRMEDKGYLRYCYNISRYHHERWDGKGYPDGLKGEQIPICAQVVAVADVYDALTSNRVYKPAYSHEKAVEMIHNGECGAFSDQLMECFRQVSDRFREIGNAYGDDQEQSQVTPDSLISQEELWEQEEQPRSQIANGLKEASAALQKETLERDALINAIPGGVAKVQADDEFRILLASDGFYKLTGYTQSEYHSAPIEGKGSRLILEEDIPHVTDVITEQLTKGLPIFVEYRIRKKDGTVAWINVHGAPAEMVYGRPVVQAVFIDYTATKRTEQKLLSLMNSVPGGIAQLRISDRISVSYVSDGFYQMSGFSREEYAGMDAGEDFLQFIYPEDRDMVESTIRHASKDNRRNFTLECRLLCKGDYVAWLLINGSWTEDDDGYPCYQCVFTDVTESRSVQEMLRMNEERYRIIVEQVQDVIFEWNMRSDNMYHSPAFKKKFGYEMPVHNYFDLVLENDIIFEDDKRSFAEFRNQLLSGMSYIEKEYRIRTHEQRYLWCRVKATVIFDQNRQPLHAIGTISDVDDYKKENALLEVKAQTDLLTGLYNKVTMENLIEDYLEGNGQDERHALFVIDIDNFKKINDTFGHLEGDAVLKEISARIRERFRSVDILGRAGGDEFVVFLKNAPSNKVVLEKANGLSEVFHQYAKQPGGHPDISGSIGISFYPDDATDFSELFRKADEALYLSKRTGKDRYTLYCDRNNHPNPC